MRFKKGEPRPEGAGRKKGSLNKKTIMKARDVLSAQDINPTERILTLIPTLDPQDQLKAWFELLSYTEAKVKESDDTDPDDDPDEMDQLRDVSEETLLKLIRQDKESA